jgi:predicted Zn finger-like uncharacterized protein
MILTCPNCGTQYVVKDGAIPPQGRQVRCASCKHSWHQDPEEASQEDAAPSTAEEVPAVAQAAEPVEAPDTGDEETIAEATLIEPRSGPEAEERAYEEALIDEGEPAVNEHAGQVAAAPLEGGPHADSLVDDRVEFQPTQTAAAATGDWREPPDAEAQDDSFSPFPDRADETRPRRGSNILRAVLIVVLVAALAAAFWFFAPPAWKARLGLGTGDSSPLALVTTHMDRQRLESGNELLTVTGRVINPTSESQSVPPLQAQLKTKTGQVVYSWTIAPPARSLPPGASARFNSAEVNVPPGGDELTITLGSPRA